MMLKMTAWTCVLAATAVVAAAEDMHGAVAPHWSGATATTVRALHNEYGNIFKYGNRNAASHLWSTFLLDRSTQMSTSQLNFFFSGYCAVSGSPTSPSDYNRYRLTLDHVDGKGKMSGYMHYCCWPCVCDTQDFFKVDTKTIETADGPSQFHFVVLGNPCDHEEKLDVPFVQPFRMGGETTLRRDAAEVRCSSTGELIGATLSDHGYVIFNTFFDAARLDHTAVSQRHEGQQPGRLTTVNGVSFQDEHEFADMCQERADNHYNSGMGEIFRKVAEITPIAIGARAGKACSAADEPCEDNSTTA